MQQIGVVLSVIGESESEELRGDLSELQQSVEFCDSSSMRHAAVDRIDRAGGPLPRSKAGSCTAAGGRTEASAACGHA